MTFPSFFLYVLIVSICFDALRIEVIGLELGSVYERLGAKVTASRQQLDVSFWDFRDSTSATSTGGGVLAHHRWNWHRWRSLQRDAENFAFQLMLLELVNTSWWYQDVSSNIRQLSNFHKANDVLGFQGKSRASASKCRPRRICELFVCGWFAQFCKNAL